jgi:hypothetical protein
MKITSPQYLVDDKGKKIFVVLPISNYEKILEELEEIEDVKMYDKAKLRKESSILFSDYLKQRRKKR